MAKTAACSIIGQTYATGNGTFGAYATTGNKYAGANSSSIYAYILQFETGNFSGKSEKLEINLSVKTMYHADLDLRYALATSDENKNSYRSTFNAVSDPNQIATGSFDMTGLSTSAYNVRTLSIDTADLKPNTTYYLFLWGPDRNCGTNLDATANHSGVLYYKSAGSYAYPNVAGQAVKCEVYPNVAGTAVKCEVYANVAGTAVKC